MANNIAVSVTVDVADLTAKRAIMSAGLKAATKDLNDFAKTANASGSGSERLGSFRGEVSSTGALQRTPSTASRSPSPCG